MLLLTLLILLTIVSVALLIKGVLREDKKTLYIFKPLSTLLIILISLFALSRPGTNFNYVIFIMIGLFFSLGGDIALMFTAETPFMAGVAMFLITQIVYGLGFTWLNGLSWQDAVCILPLLIVGAAAIYLFLLPSLGKMKIPTAIYILAINFMVWRALATMFGTTVSPAKAMLISIGALLFYFSDAILAFYKFKSPSYYGQPFNLATYYTGQLLIALSTLPF